MAELQEVYNNIYSHPDVRNQRTFVTLFEKNGLVIENANLDLLSQNKGLIIQLTGDYAIALSGIGNLSKSIIYFNKAIPLIENSGKEKSIDLFKTPLYEAMLWHRGVTFYYLKQYKLASTDFEKLVKNFPDNERYSNWMKSALIIKLNRIGNVFWGITFLGLFVSIVTDRGTDYHETAQYIGICAILSAITVEILKFMKKKKLPLHI